MRALLAILAAVCTAAGGAAAQDSPREAADQYVDAMRDGDWGRVARLMHPAALGELKNLLGTLAMADSAGQVLQPLFDVRTSAEFDALTPVEVYERLTARAAGASPQARTALQGMRAEVLGEVMEGADTAHVVYRMTTTLGDAPMQRVDVVTFRRHGSRWLALLTADLRGLAETLGRALQQR